MYFKDLFKLGVLTLAIAFLALSCASSEPKSDFELDIDSDEITVAVSEAVARGLMEDLIGADLECDGDLDRHLKAFLRDGENTVDGRRRGSKLDLKIRGAGSGKIEATMPWAIAECMLGRNTSIDDTLTSSIKVKVTNEDGRDFSFRLR